MFTAGKDGKLPSPANKVDGQVFAKKPKCKHSGNKWRTRRHLPGYRKIYCCKRWQHKQCNTRNEVGLWMEMEVIRIMSFCPKWKPAIQYGRNVNAYRRQPITFIVETVQPKQKEKESAFN